MLIYLIYKAQITLLIAEKVKILAEYLDFADVFFKKISCKAFQMF